MHPSHGERAERFSTLILGALVVILGLFLARLWSEGLLAGRPVLAQETEVEREGRVIGKTIRQRERLDPSAVGTSLLWPVPTTQRIGDRFGPRLHPVLHVPILHAGIDVPAWSGEPVVAAGSGQVLMTGELRDYGRIVIIDHGGRLATVYAHLSAVSVQEGEAVHQGEGIGLVGASGQVTGPHLHFEVRQDGTPRNPLEFVRPAATPPRTAFLAFFVAVWL